MTPVDALEVITALADCFPGRVPPPTMRVWAMAIEQYDHRQALAAVARVAQECEHPSLKALVDRMGNEKPADRAVQAFDLVRRAIGKHGMYCSVDFTDRAINAAIRSMGGWVRLCMMPSEEFELWGRKEFERVYAVYSASGASEGEAGDYLAGVAERENGPRGFGIESPKRVGSGVTEQPAPRRISSRSEVPAAPKSLTETQRAEIRRLTEAIGKGPVITPPKPNGHGSGGQE